jgi:hypothetical protein
MISCYSEDLKDLMAKPTFESQRMGSVGTQMPVVKAVTHISW